MIKQESYKNKYKAGQIAKPYAPFEKTDDYFRKMAEHFYGIYCADQSSVLYGGRNSRRSYKELRDHARGLQSTEKYRDILDPVDGKTKKRRINISWDTVDYLSKFRAIIHDKMVSMKLVPHTVANDEMARTKKDKLASKMRLAVKPQGKEFLENIPYEMSFQNKMQGVDNEADLDFFISMGGIRLAIEIALKDGIDATLNESDYDDSLASMIADDIIDLNAAGVHIYFDKALRKFIWEYVDPATVVIASSTHEDHRDADYAGFIKRRSIEEIRRVSGLGDEAMEKIAKTYSDYNGASYSQWSYRGDGRRENYVGSSRPFDSFGVEVMTVYWVDAQYYRHVEGEHKMGNSIFDPVGPDSELSNRDKKKGKQIVENIVQYVYKTNWIVGTPYCYGSGINDIVVREGAPGSKRAVLPVIFWKGHGKSLIERCIPFNDDIQLSVMKIRHLKAKIPPGPRMALDKSKLTDSVKLGGRRYNWLDMMEIYYAGGVLMYESNGDFSVPGIDSPQQVGSPITFIPTGVAEDFQIYTNDILNGIDGFRSVTGVNPISDGSNTNPDMLKAVMEGMLEATNSALRPDIRKMKTVFRKSAYVTMGGLRKALANGIMAYDDIPMSEDVRRVLNRGGDLLGDDWSIFVEIQTPQQRQQLMAELQRYADHIPPEIYFSIKNMVMANDLKKAEFMLAKAITEAKKEAHKQQMEVTRAQAIAQGEAGQMVEAAKQKTIQLQTQSKLAENAGKSKSEIEKIQKQHELDMVKMEREIELKKEASEEVVRENLKQVI